MAHRDIDLLPLQTFLLFQPNEQSHKPLLTQSKIFEPHVLGIVRDFLCDFFITDCQHIQQDEIMVLSNELCQTPFVKNNCDVIPISRNYSIVMGKTDDVYFGLFIKEGKQGYVAIMTDRLFDQEGNEEFAKDSITSLAVSSDHNRFLADCNSNTVSVHSSSNEFLFSFYVQEPDSMVIFGQELFITSYPARYIDEIPADTKEDGVKVFSVVNGTFLRSFAPLREGLPTGIAIHPLTKEVIITNQLKSQVQFFTLEGKYLRTFKTFKDEKVLTEEEWNDEMSLRYAEELAPHTEKATISKVWYEDEMLEPDSVCVHPISGRIYVRDSVDKAIITLPPNV